MNNPSSAIINPLVTIAIPTYERADGYLKIALESALNQTYPNIEILVSDNCSPDDTEKVVKSYADARVRYYRQHAPLVPNDNFNFCLHESRGAFFLLLHDDDEIDRDFVETCTKAMHSSPSCGLVRTGTRIINSQGQVVGENPNLAGGLTTAELFLAWFEGRTAPYLCSTLFNTELLREAGGFRSRHNLFQDVAAHFRLAAQFGRVDVREAKASFRKHGSNATGATAIRAWCEDSIYLLSLMCRLAPEQAEEIRDRGSRFLARINYSRASAIRTPISRLKGYWVSYRTFGWRNLPPPMLLFQSTALYRALRTMKRRILGLPAWVD